MERKTRNMEVRFYVKCVEYPSSHVYVLVFWTRNFVKTMFALEATPKNIRRMSATFIIFWTWHVCWYCWSKQLLHLSMAWDAWERNISMLQWKRLSWPALTSRWLIACWTWTRGHHRSLITKLSQSQQVQRMMHVLICRYLKNNGGQFFGARAEAQQISKPNFYLDQNAD